jgi:hypothetical protein
MNVDIVNNLVCRFYEEIIKNGDNIIPTRVSIITYGYFQLLYNILTIFSNYVPSNDKVNIYNWHAVLKNRFLNITAQQKNITFLNFLFYGHQGYLNALYSEYKIDSLQMNDLNMIDIKLENNIQLLIISWAKEHFISKNIKMEKTTPNNYGLIIDITENFNTINSNPDKWINLTIPSGKYLDENNNPIIDINASSTFITQTFQDENFGDISGFSILSKSDMPDYSTLVKTTWINSMDKEIQNILNIYENLDDTKKTLAEFYSFTGNDNVSVAGFWIIIAMMIAQRNSQTDDKNIIMYFVLSCGILDGMISSWFYKNLYKTPRPISLIRHYYNNIKINSWSPIIKSGNINGNQWFPYQSLTTISPSSPEFLSDHVVISVVSSKLIEWWFNTNKFYDPYKLVSIPNPHFLSDNLNKQYKTFRCGEFVFEKNSSVIENNTPKQVLILKYITITDMCNDAIQSGIYGGIYTENTKNISVNHGNFIFDRVRGKFESNFGIKSIYNIDRK